VVPDDSPETRLTRLEVHQANDRRQLDTLAPLIVQYAQLREAVDDLARDLDRATDQFSQQARQIHDDFVAAMARDRRDLEERLIRAVNRFEQDWERFQKSVTDQILVCNQRVEVKSAEAMDAIVAHEERVKSDAKELVSARRNLNVALIGALAVVLAALITSTIPGLLH
jgi:uncharacterized coiled-coil protein SlyX